VPCAGPVPLISAVSSAPLLVALIRRRRLPRPFHAPIRLTRLHRIWVTCAVVPVEVLAGVEMSTADLTVEFVGVCHATAPG
jgi:hypothetical protein